MSGKFDNSNTAVEHKNKLVEIIHEHSSNGTKIIGYGASARSSTLLNFCGIDHRHLICTADGNPLKHGKYSAGTDILITPTGFKILSISCRRYAA